MTERYTKEEKEIQKVEEQKNSENLEFFIEKTVYRTPSGKKSKKNIGVLTTSDGTKIEINARTLFKMKKELLRVYPLMTVRD
jgi:hypothetical protein